MTHTKLRLALQEKYGKRCYRITRCDEVHIYGYAPNSNMMCWWLMGDIDIAYLWMNICHNYTPSWHTRSNGQPLDTEE